VADETQDFLAELQRDLNRAEAEKTQAEIVSHEQRKRVRWITAISLTSLVGISSLTFVAFRQSQEAGRAAVAEREARLDAEQQFQSTRQINDFLTNVLSATRPEELGREVTHRQVIDKAIPQLEGRFRNQPAVEGSLRMTLGETYRWLDAVDLAEDQLRQAIDAFQRADSLDERSILRAKNELAEVLLVHDRSDDQPEAIQLRREVVGRSQELFGKADPLTIDAMIGLGKVLTFNSEHEEAEEWLTKAQRIIRETEELEGFDSRPLLLNLARVHKHLDRTEEAEAMYKSLLNDPESSSVIRMSAMMQLGEMYHWDEQLVLAEKTLNQALELYQRELGKDHRLTLSTMRKYIRVLDEAKQYQRLLQIADENILLHENWDGIARSSVMEARKMKALALAGVGKLDEAEAFFRESISLVRMHRGDDSRQAERARKDLDRFLKKYRD
jgi:tetratricopeptide (TPR) repeat protein